MPLTILYFAWVKEKVGAGEERLDVPSEVSSVSDLMDWLAQRSPRHAGAFADRKLIKVAVDQVHVPLSTVLGSAREVAFFPPVTGG